MPGFNSQEKSNVPLELQLALGQVIHLLGHEECVSLDTPTLTENDVTSGNFAYQAHQKFDVKGGPGDEAKVLTFDLEV